MGFIKVISSSQDFSPLVYSWVKVFVRIKERLVSIPFNEAKSRGRAEG
jgi:hypothetical protein